METLEILSDEKLMKSIQAGQKDAKENNMLSFKEVLDELSINEKELWANFYQGISKAAQAAW